MPDSSIRDYFSEIQSRADYSKDVNNEEILRYTHLERKYRIKLLMHPNCSDPLHPGCDNCFNLDFE